MRKRPVLVWAQMTLAFASLVWPHPAPAVDGVIEFNQAAVFAGGITPGDTPGFPVTLSQPGSYRLTGNLDVTKMQNGNPQTSSENIGAIRIAADNVTIDLNGFSILGPCSGTSVPCAPTGSGSGIFVSSAVDSVLRNATITNGTIQGMGQNGITLNADPAFLDNARIERVTVDRNGGTGIIVSSVSMVNACIARGNGSAGISMGFGGSGNVVSGNTSAANGGAGIASGLGRSLLVGNIVSLNQGFGLNATLSGYLNNVMNANSGGTVSGGLNLGHNMCDSVLCP